ncbi:hypothetical protein C8R46DRAFT_1164174 [Mycena filopes]|nr:hypothetical protein C8R46DRAFT_1164174 [Mycena filopes]
MISALQSMVNKSPSNTTEYCWSATDCGCRSAFKTPPINHPPPANASTAPTTAVTAELIATLVALQNAPQEQDLVIRSTKKTLRATVLDRLPGIEDRGWIGIQDREPQRALVAELRGRSGETSFLDTKREDSRQVIAGRAEAGRLAKLGCKEEPKEVRVDFDLTLQLNGAKLLTLTQTIAYVGIKELRGAVSRKATDNNVKQIKAATQQTFNRIPTTPQIWKSLRDRDLTRQVKNFLWKSVHSAHRIGNFWTHIPDCRERAVCKFCNEPEDLEHILLKCRRPGQALMWSLAKNLWLRKHKIWPELSLGGILGVGLADFLNEKGKSLRGASRLYRILISETAFAIWKNGESLPENLIHNRWLHAINLRLNFDLWQAKLDQVIPRPPNSTLKDEDKLPENWINKEPRVLVGIGPKSSQPPSQPSGRRGRGR